MYPNEDTICISYNPTSKDIRYLDIISELAYLASAKHKVNRLIYRTNLTYCEGDSAGSPLVESFDLCECRSPW